MSLQAKKHVQIYTDGACSGNPGPGGWAAILKFGVHEKELSGNMHLTTNNRMELFAVISALGALKEPCQVEVFSDSTYVVHAFEKNWIEAWQKRGWKTTENKPVENQDLWKLLLLTMRKHEVKFFKVPAHQDHPQNNRCDELAKEEVQKVIKIFRDVEPEGKAAAPQ
ncbi:MAG: ribonuclease HI [Christensenellales bacterium]